MKSFVGNIIIMTLLLVGIVISVMTVSQTVSSGQKDQNTTGTVMSVINGIKKNESGVNIMYSVNGINYTFSAFTKSNVSVGDRIKVYYNDKNPTKASLSTTKMPLAMGWLITVITVVGVFFFVLNKFGFNINVSDFIEFIFEFILDILCG